MVCNEVEICEHNVQYRCNTTLSPVVPSPPSDVSVSQNGLSRVLVSWRSGDPNATGYIIYYQQHYPQNLRLLLIDGADTTSATITGLITGATYSISVASTSDTLPSTVTAAPHDVTIGMLLAETIKCSLLMIHFFSRASHHLPHLLSFTCCGWRVCLSHLLCHSA